MVHLLIAYHLLQLELRTKLLHGSKMYGMRMLVEGLVALLVDG